MKKVYVSMIADLLHSGHIKILKKAAELGEVTVGLLTTEACGELNDLPYLDFEKRREVLENLSLVYKVIPQTTASYKNILNKLKPDYVVHGNDWISSPQKKYRKEVIDELNNWSGKLVEVKYSSDICDLKIKEELTKLGITTTARQSRLRKLIQAKPVVKILEVHNALSGLIAENASEKDKDNSKLSFDGMWSSSLTDSTSKGKPDIEAVDTSARLTTVNEIFEVTTKPMIYDADTGGKPEHFEFMVRSLERTGVSAVIIEDKTGLKKNSLFGNDVPQTQDTIENFCHKIKTGKKAQITNDFMIIARIESLILNKGINDALQRAKKYINAGADGIMIHSKRNNPSEIFEFCKFYNKFKTRRPLVIVPSSFSQVTEEKLSRAGANIVIYANHLLRSVYPNMVNTAKSILKNKRAYQIEKKLLTIKDILELIPGTK